jgi:hypothetical protein
MKKNPMSIAVFCDSEAQREHALQVAKDAGIAFGSIYSKTEWGNVLRVYEDGDWCFLDSGKSAAKTYTYAEFIAKYDNPQAFPTDLEQRLTDLECKLGELTNLLNEIRERL